MLIKPTHITDYSQDVLVKCPQCDQCAHLIGIKNESKTKALPWSDNRRLLCQHCGYIQDWVIERDGWTFTPASGPDIAGLNLWLQTNCCGHVLLAFNADHITCLEEYIGAKIRNVQQDPQWGCCNGSLQSRLPQWMIEGKNRVEVLKALMQLRGMLPK